MIREQLRRTAWRTHAVERYPIGLRGLPQEPSPQDIEKVVIQIWRAARFTLEKKKPLEGAAPDRYCWEELLIFMERHGFNTEEHARNGIQPSFFRLQIDEIKQALSGQARKKIGKGRARSSRKRIQQLEESMRAPKADVSSPPNSCNALTPAAA